MNIPPLPERLLALPDIHTHIQKNGAYAMMSLSPEEAVDYATAHPGRLFSIGIHPWEQYVSASDERQRFASLETALRLDGAAAVGETGLDSLRGPAIELQIERFRHHIALSEALMLPLVIHMVKSQDALFAILKETRPTQPWIIHGFRGKARQARQLADAGLYISFGERFNPEAFAAVPIRQRLAETDESPMSIVEIRARHKASLPPPPVTTDRSYS